jgi:hypothetical protein
MMKQKTGVWHFRIGEALKAAVIDYAESEDVRAASAVRDLLKDGLRARGMWPRRPAADQVGDKAPALA